MVSVFGGDNAIDYVPVKSQIGAVPKNNFWHSHCFKRQSKFYLDIWMVNDAVASDSHLVNPKVCCKVIILMAVFLDPFLEIAHLGQKTVDLLPLSR